jgi:Protein of unknown function (DUF3300)
MAGGSSYEGLTESSGDISFVVDVMGSRCHVRFSDRPIDRTSPSLPVEKQTPEGLQQLVAPIALYPDALVSLILAGATYPTEIVQADRWVQEHSNLKGKDLPNAVDQQSWDPSIKALTQFPSVLANMDKNLPWTSALGEAYVNKQEAVMDAVQVMRARQKRPEIWTAIIR